MRQVLVLTVLGVPLVYLALSLTHKPPAVVKHTVRPIAASASPAPLPQQHNRSLPVRLKVPKLSIDANILYLGLTTTGDIASPKNVTDVGWYKSGPLPGNNGSALIDGHIDGLRGEPGVFAHLDKLQPGDTVSVTDDQGRVADFAVRETRTYDQQAHPDEIFTSDNKSHLNLITCTGAWDKDQHQFLKRLVVFTDRVD